MWKARRVVGEAEAERFGGERAQFVSDPYGEFSQDATIYNITLYRRCREGGGSKVDCKDVATIPAGGYQPGR